MIRFIIERGATGEVSVKALNGWVSTDPASLLSDAGLSGRLGFGEDPPQPCMNLAKIILALSLGRQPLIDRFASQFMFDMLRVQFADSFTLSSCDVQQWLLDLVAEQVQRNAETRRDAFTPEKRL